MILPLLLALVQAPSIPEPERRITIPATVARLENFTGPLTDRLGIPVVIGPGVRDEVLGIYAKQVTRRELAGQIAHCVGAEWVIEGGRLVLRTTQATEARVRERSQQYRLRKILEMYAKMRANLERQGEFTQTVANGLAEQIKGFGTNTNFLGDPQVATVNAKSPLGRFIQQVILAIPPSLIASASGSERLVFRPHPKARQKPLPDLRRALEQLRSEMAIYSKALVGIDMSKNRGIWMEMFPAALTAFELSNDPEIMMEMSVYGGGFSVRTGIFDSMGAQIASHWMPFDWYVAPPVREETEKLDFGPVATEMVEAYKAAREKRLKPLSAETREFLLNPERFDPLELGCEPGIRAWGDKSGKPVVAALTDGMAMQSLGILRGTLPTLGSFLSRLNAEEVVEHEGWMVARPNDPVAARSERSNRQAVGRWLRQIDENGPSIRETLRLFAAHGEGPGTFCLTWFRMLFPERADRSIHSVYGSSAQVMSGLSDAQIDNLNKGGTMRWRDLSVQSRQTIESAIYDRKELRIMVHDSKSVQSSLLREPTEVLPGALPTDALVSFERKVETRNAAILTPYPSTFAREPRPSNVLGYQIARKGAGTTGPIKDWPEKFVRLKAETWTLRVTFQPNIYSEFSFTDNFAPHIEAFSLESIPPDIKERVTKWIEYYRKRPEEPPPRIDFHFMDYDPPEGG